MNYSKHYSRPGTKYEQPKLVINAEYLVKDWIKQLTTFFKLNDIEQEMLRESFYEVDYIKTISPRNNRGDGIRFIAFKNWVRHHIVGQGFGSSPSPQPTMAL